MLSHRLLSHYRKGKSHFRNLHDAFGTLQEVTLRKDGLTRHEKPLNLPKSFINHYTMPGETVLDLFGSSGSTLIAAEYLGRKCLMMELNPAYCDVIVKRWETFTGETAKKI